MTLIPSLRPTAGPASLPGGLAEGMESGRSDRMRPDAPGPDASRPEALRPDLLGARADRAVGPLEGPGLGARATPGVTAPRDVDPELWSLLTSEERAHFARSQALGPLTYGRAPSTESTQPPMRGLRLDLRV